MPNKPKPQSTTKPLIAPGIDEEMLQKVTFRKTTPERAPDGRWICAPGPGRPPGRLSLTDLVRIYQAKPIEEVREIYREGKISAIVATACRVVLDSAERTGSVEVMKEGWNRTEGKVPDRLEVQTERVVFNINLGDDDNPKADSHPTHTLVAGS